MTASEVSLLSLQFWGLSLAAILLLTILQGNARHGAFMAANFFFLTTTLLGPIAASATVAFCFLGYVIVNIVRIWPRWGFRVGVGAYLLLFIWMRNYEVVDWVFPDNRLAYTLSTIGLSFLLFRIIHVIIEVRSGVIGHVEFLSFFNYSLNFTTFLMGPIQRYRHFLDQWSGRTIAIPLDFEAHLDAVVRILIGLFKAYVLGAFISPFANVSASELGSATFIYGLLHIYAFYIYLYLNFSGYCDVVIGIGALMGIRPPENFDKPFIAKNVSEFWLRMHRSLSTWLTDYVFSPLYKWFLTSRWFSKRPNVALNVSLMTTMVVCGLWHGTTVSFLVFGVLHGAYLVIYRTWDMFLARLIGREGVRIWRSRPMVQLGGMFLTFNAVAFAFIFFRLEAHDAVTAISRMAGL